MASANAEVTWFYIDAFVLVTQQVTPGCGVDSVFACYQHFAPIFSQANRLWSLGIFVMSVYFLR